MPGAGALASVVGNFLGTYTSRNSCFDGYWLFGLLVVDLGRLDVDLLRAGGLDTRSPATAAETLAAAHFQDQLCKAGIDGARVAEATLVVEVIESGVERSVDGRPRIGSLLRFLASATLRNGRRAERDRVVFVAPHDPRLERPRVEPTRG